MALINQTINVTRRCLPFILTMGMALKATAAEEINIDTLGMEVSEEEILAIKQAMAYGIEISKAAEKINGLPYRRDAHAKATGCVRATFSVNGDIPEHYRYSIFSSPGKKYDAWIRFSNGDMTVQADKKPDARGMAIKLMNVSGTPIAPELPGAPTQDFIMTNTPAFFHRNVFDYVDDMKYLAKLERTRWFISLWPPRLHPKRLYRATQTVSAKINTPLEPQYYSMVPYQLGHIPLKFSAKPCDGMTFPTKVDKSEYDYLTTVMQDHLNSGSACFDFLVQEKVAGKNLPIDDATVIWSEKDAPFTPIARVHIPSQTFTSEAQQEFCENLSMNPWHGVDEWLPLGSLNTSRRLVYHTVSKFRHEKNSARLFQPTSWCLENDTTCDLSQYFHAEPSSTITPEFDPMYSNIKNEEDSSSRLSQY